MQQAHRASVGVRQNRLCAIFCADVFEARGNFIQRFIPRNPLKFALTFCADSSRWIQQSSIMIGSLNVARHFGTQKAVGNRVIWIALHFDCASILHRYKHGAGVGAIVWADGADSGWLGICHGIILSKQ